MLVKGKTKNQFKNNIMGDNIFPNLDMLNVPAFCLLVVRTLLAKLLTYGFMLGLDVLDTAFRGFTMAQ